MKETLETTVLDPEGNEHKLELVQRITSNIATCFKEGNEHKLELVTNENDDVLTFVLDGKAIFDGDWSRNFAKLFDRAIIMWGAPPEEE